MTTWRVLSQLRILLFFKNKTIRQRKCSPRILGELAENFHRKERLKVFKKFMLNGIVHAHRLFTTSCIVCYVEITCNTYYNVEMWIVVILFWYRYDSYKCPSIFMIDKPFVLKTLYLQHIRHTVSNILAPT